MKHHKIASGVLTKSQSNSFSTTDFPVVRLLELVAVVVVVVVVVVVLVVVVVGGGVVLHP